MGVVTSFFELGGGRGVLKKYTSYEWRYARFYIFDRINGVDLNQVCLTGNAPEKRKKMERREFGTQ